MRSLRPLIATVLMVLWVAGCYGWHREPLTPVPRDSEESRRTVRITTHEGKQFVLRLPVVRSDSIVGLGDRGLVSLALDEIDRIDVRRFSVVRTGGLILGVAACCLGVPILLSIDDS